MVDLDPLSDHVVFDWNARMLSHVVVLILYSETQVCFRTQTSYQSV